MVLFFTIIYRILQVYFYFLIAYVLMSWIPEIRGTKIHNFVSKVADPYMRIFRGILVIGMFDFTPILGFILYNLGMRYLAEAINLMIMSM